MANAIPLQVDTQADYTLIEAGETVIVEVEKATHSKGQGKKGEWNKFNLQMVVRGPAEYAGKRVFHGLFIGSANNNAKLDAIWAAAGLPQQEDGDFAAVGIRDLDETLADLVGARFAIEVGVNTYTKKALQEDGSFADEEKSVNDIAREDPEKSWSDLQVFPVDSVDIEVLEEGSNYDAD